MLYGTNGIETGISHKKISSLNSVNPAIVDQTALDMSTDVDGIELSLAPS